MVWTLLEFTTVYRLAEKKRKILFKVIDILRFFSRKTSMFQKITRYDKQFEPGYTQTLSDFIPMLYITPTFDFVVR